MNWISVFGLIIVILLLIPNIIYFRKNKTITNHYHNPVVLTLEQLGRYGSMFLMVFSIGISEFGFRSKGIFLLWLCIHIIFILFYWLLWIFYFKKPRTMISILLAVVPGVLFLNQGILLGHWLLVIFGLVFSISHIYITNKNLGYEAEKR